MSRKVPQCPTPYPQIPVTIFVGGFITIKQIFCREVIWVGVSDKMQESCLQSKALNKRSHFLSIESQESTTTNKENSQILAVTIGHGNNRNQNSFRHWDASLREKYNQTEIWMHFLDNRASRVPNRYLPGQFFSYSETMKKEKAKWWLRAPCPNDTHLYGRHNDGRSVICSVEWETAMQAAEPDADSENPREKRVWLNCLLAATEMVHGKWNSRESFKAGSWI